jgi:hypothetical protein
MPIFLLEKQFGMELWFNGNSGASLCGTQIHFSSYTAWFLSTQNKGVF